MGCEYLMRGNISNQKVGLPAISSASLTAVARLMVMVWIFSVSSSTNSPTASLNPSNAAAE